MTNFYKRKKAEDSLHVVKYSEDVLQKSPLFLVNLLKNFSRGLLLDFIFNCSCHEQV